MVLEIALGITKGIVLVLGTTICYFAYDAYHRTSDPALRALSIGFAIITLGALSGGIAHVVFEISITGSILINTVLTATGFTIIMYSLQME